MRAFEKGADGVYVAGCLEGDCHFMHGNLVAKPRVNYTKKLIQEVGLEPERLGDVQYERSYGAQVCRGGK